MKKLLSLSLMLSLGLATVTPALNAAQSQTVAQSQKNPAHASGWQAAKKWWRSGRNMKALNRQEQRAFNALKKKFTIGAIIAAIVAMIGGGAAYLHRKPASGAAVPYVAPVPYAARPAVRTGAALWQTEQEEPAEVAAGAAAPATGYLKRELFHAIHFGNIDKVEDLLQRGADVNTVILGGGTALIHATRKGHENIVEKLLQVDGIDVNARSEDRKTALIWAAAEGHYGIVEKLLKVDGIDVNAADQHRETALMMAISYGHYGIVEKLLTVDGIDLNAHNTTGETALMIAAKQSNSDIMKLLLKVDGFDVNAKNRYGETPLTITVRKNNRPFVERLLPHASDENRAKAIRVARENDLTDLADVIEDFRFGGQTKPTRQPDVAPLPTFEAAVAKANLSPAQAKKLELQAKKLELKKLLMQDDENYDEEKAFALFMELGELGRPKITNIRARSRASQRIIQLRKRAFHERYKAR